MENETQKILIGLKKACSITNKVIKMLEDGDYCIKVMQQNLAVIGLLRSAHEALMRRHLNTCFKNAMSSNNEKKKQEMIEEILKVIRLFNR